MAATINFFRFIRKSYHLVGIHSLSRQNSQSGPYNWRNSMGLLSLAVMFLASTAFFLFQSDSFEDYQGAFYVSTTGLVVIILVIKITPKMADIFILMEKFEEFVESRAQEDPSLKDKYIEMNNRMERISQIIYSVAVISHLMGMLIFSLLQTAINYYIDGLGYDSFHLYYLSM